MVDLFNSVQWYSSPTAYWTIQYEYQRSGSSMQYRFGWKVWLKSSSAYYNNGLQLQLFLNGTQYNVTVKPYQKDNAGWSYSGTTEWYTVAKTSGTTPFQAKLYDTNTKTVETTSSSYSLVVSATGAYLTLAQDFTDEETPLILYMNPAGENVTKLEACISFDGITDDVTYRDVSTTASGHVFELTEEERNILREGADGTTATVYFILRTTIGDAVFYSTKAQTLTITNANPIFSASYISYYDENFDTVAVTGDDQLIIQNLSHLVVEFEDAKALKGSEIVSYTVEVNGITKTAQYSPIQIGTVDSSQDVPLTVTATDNRGNSTSATITVRMLDWNVPIFTASVERVNNYEAETHLYVDAEIPSTNGGNSITKITYERKESGGEYANPVEIDNRVEEIITCDENKAFVFRITVHDALGRAVSKEYQLAKGKFPLFIDTQKNAVGINDFPEGDEALRVSGGVGRFDSGIVIASVTEGSTKRGVGLDIPKGSSTSSPSAASRVTSDISSEQSTSVPSASLALSILALTYSLTLDLNAARFSLSTVRPAASSCPPNFTR